MKFTLEIELGNDAMQTSHDIANLLSHVVALLSYDHQTIEKSMIAEMRGELFDTNGNTVGLWQVTA